MECAEERVAIMVEGAGVRQALEAILAATRQRDSTLGDDTPIHVASQDATTTGSGLPAQQTLPGVDGAKEPNGFDPAGKVA